MTDQENTSGSTGAAQHKLVRGLIWLYLFLLVFEGALRKWIVPGLSGPLLIIRDPVVILIYAAAAMTGVFPIKSIWIWTIGLLATVTFGISFLAETVNLKVMLFGVRTNFLHLPLIFVIPKVFREKDLLLVGKWVLLAAIPQALIMAAQFRVGPGHWLNVAAGGEGGQLESAMGKVRASGTFSFITGPVGYFSLVTVFLLYNEVRRSYPVWLSFLGTGALLIAAAASGSRTLVGTVVIILAFFALAIVLHPPAMAKGFRVVVIGGIAYLGVNLLDIFHEARVVMQKRIELASTGSVAGWSGIFRRVADSFDIPFAQAPMFGKGLGVGTNAGASILSGRRRFLLAENEWQRITLESGPVVGPLFILLRVVMALSFLGQAIKAAFSGRLLPLLFWGAGGLIFVNGQFGPPTILGFAVVFMGCALASLEREAVPALAARKKARRKASEATFAVETVNRPRVQPGRWAVRPQSGKGS